MEKNTPGNEKELNKNRKQPGFNQINTLNELENDLESLKLVDEPVDVTYQVMQKVSAKKTKDTPLRSSTSFFGSLLRPAPVSFALVLVAGIIVGSAMTWILFSDNTQTNEQVLTGTISANPKDGFTFTNKTTDMELATFQIGNLHYLNVTVNTETELQMVITFKETDFTLKKSGYISFRGKETDTYEKGTVLFMANGKTTYQVVLEKLHSQLASVTIEATQDKSMVLNRQVFLK